MSRKPAKPKPPLEMKLRVLSAVDYAPGESTRERIKSVSQRTFCDETNAHDYRFTWRTIESWPKRSTIFLPTLRFNKTGVMHKMALYRKLLEQHYFSRSQLSQTSFYRMVRENDLLDIEQTKKS